MLSSSIAIEIEELAGRCIISSIDGHDLSKTKLHGKDFEFTCLLLASGTRDFISAEDVYRLPLWKNMKIQSVGKQVSRLINRLQGIGFDIFDYKQKTLAWRLALSVAQNITPATYERAKAFIAATGSTDTQAQGDSSLLSTIYWAAHNVKALLDMTSGNAENGYMELKLGYAQATSIPSQAISNVIATRIGQRLQPPHLPLPREQSAQPSMFELAVEARRTAAYALRSKASDWATFIKELKLLLPSVIRTGDSTTQSIIYNALALLFKRQEDFDQALAYIRLAAPLAVFSGDLILIQNVMFNFGNVLSEMQREQPHICKPRDYFILLELDIEIRQRFNIGNDSAQAEMLVAFLYLEKGDFAKSQYYLNLGKLVIALSDQPADKALCFRVSGLLEIAKNNNDDKSIVEGISLLQKASKLYGELGNEPAKKQVEAEISQLLA